MAFHTFGAHPLLALNSIPVSGCTGLFSHSRTGGHLGDLQLLAIMNKAAVNICVQVFMWT